MSATEYRPGDIAMVRFDEVDDPYTCVLIGGNRWQSVTMAGFWTGIPLEVGPVLGNVADIAASGSLLSDEDLVDYWHRPDPTDTAKVQASARALVEHAKRQAWAEGARAAYEAERDSLDGSQVPNPYTRAEVTP